MITYIIVFAEKKIFLKDWIVFFTCGKMLKWFLLQECLLSFLCLQEFSLSLRISVSSSFWGGLSLATAATVNFAFFWICLKSLPLILCCYCLVAQSFLSLCHPTDDSPLSPLLNTISFHFGWREHACPGLRPAPTLPRLCSHRLSCSLILDRLKQ